MWEYLTTFNNVGPLLVWMIIVYVGVATIHALIDRFKR